ncbi:MAG: glycoside hydrolase family 20 zincin-like fold domain-containing protein [Bacteroidota bacterium]
MKNVPLTRNILFLIFTALIFKAHAQVHLIPQPKKLELNNSDYQFNSPTSIYAPDIKRFHLEDFDQILYEELKIKVNAIKKSKKADIVFLKFDSKNELNKTLKKSGLSILFDPSDEGYIIKIDSKKIQLFSLTDAGIFYGIQTLKQLIKANRTGNKIPGLVIYDKPSIFIRAWQDDISRGPIPTMDMLKQEIRTMASFKLNYFTLYTEHVFKLEEHPEIAPADGISKQELIELGEFAKKYHVKLIGNYQSFGHMAKTLSHPDYQHLAENGHIISPVLEESYEFLSDVYEEIVPLNDGEYFNINCDETFGLGEGKSKGMVDSIGVAGVYVKHINRLNDLLKEYNKKILMWGDIVTSYPEAIPQLPGDMTVMAWGYHPAKSFDYAITPISSQGLNFWVAPGVNCWSNIYPNLGATEINVNNFIRDGFKLNATGVLNTSWDDDGLNFFNNNWHGFAWGAENSWNPAPSGNTIRESEQERKVRYSQFNSAFDALYYGIEGGMITDIMHNLSSLHNADVRDVLKNSRFFEPIFPIHMEYVQEGKKEVNQLVLLQLNSLSEDIKKYLPQIKYNKHTVDYISYAIKQVEFMVKKNLFRIALNDYLEGETDDKEALKTESGSLIAMLTVLKDEYARLWRRENREWWLDQNLKKFDNLLNHLKSIDSYCIITAHNEVNEQGRKITMRSVFNDLPVHYVINDSTFGGHSLIYKEPIYLNRDATIQARSYKMGKPGQVMTKDVIFHKGIGHLYQLNSSYSRYHPSYDGGGEYALLDGVQGDVSDLRSGKWQGFSGQDINIEIDFQKAEEINSLSMSFYQNTFSWVIFPKQVKIYVKDKLEDDYQLQAVIEGTIPPEEEGSIIQDYKTEFDQLKTRYLKVVAKYYGKLPEWHHAGSQYESMVFADEIIIR